MAIEAKTKMTRVNTLKASMDYVTNDRNLDNGDPEDNFSRIAHIWTWWFREKYGITFDITATDVAMCSIMIKQARLLVTETKHDNWIDIAGYAACGAETASIEELRETEAVDGGAGVMIDGKFHKRIPIPDPNVHLDGPSIVETGILVVAEDEEAINARIRGEMARLAEGK